MPKPHKPVTPYYCPRCSREGVGMLATCPRCLQELCAGCRFEHLDAPVCANCEFEIAMKGGSPEDNPSRSVCQCHPDNVAWNGVHCPAHKSLRNTAPVDTAFDFQI